MIVTPQNQSVLFDLTRRGILVSCPFRSSSHCLALARDSCPLYGLVTGMSPDPIGLRIVLPPRNRVLSRTYVLVCRFVLSPHKILMLHYHLCFMADVCSCRLFRFLQDTRPNVDGYLDFNG